MHLCRPSPHGSSGGVARSITKVPRICRTPASAATVRGRRVIWAGRRPHAHHHHPQQSPPEADGDHPSVGGGHLEPLFASLSVAIDTIDVAHSQLRLAHSSGDPTVAGSAARVVLSQLTHLSLLERSYSERPAARRRARLEARVRDHRDRLKSLHLDTKRLQFELRGRDEEAAALHAALAEAEARNVALEAELRLPGLDAAYFRSALRHALAAVRRFVELMENHMAWSRWDLDAAAGALQPNTFRCGGRPEHRSLVFEALVCRSMLSGFHRRDFGVPGAGETPERQHALAEFLALKAATAREALGGVVGEEEGRRFGEFCRGRYLGLVEAKMETSFFGNVDQREMMAAGRGFPETGFFMAFSEMARRVWMLHRLANAFGNEGRPAIFQVRRGRRFSEAYMEEVGGEDEGERRTVGAAARSGGGGAPQRAVGFMVVPGFKVGKAVIRAKVYVARGTAAGGRS